MKPWLMVLTLLLGAHAALAADVIVDAPYVADALKRGAIVWDVRPADAYAKGHIHGAVSIGDAPKVLRDDNTEDFIATGRIEKILGDGGIDPGREIVVYGNRGTWNPYFGLYTIQYFGGASVRVYHGGIEDWIAAARPVSAEAQRLPAIALRLTEHPGVAVSTREVIARLDDPKVQMLDVRTPKEFSGEDIRAIRGGHIKGAINIPYEQNWVDPDTPLKLARRQVADSLGMSLKSVAELKQLYSRLDPEKETIVYCQSGARASESAGVLQQLGFRNVRVYDASWLGYGNTLDAPAGNETFFNVGLLNSRMAALQARIDQLEKELAAARSAK